MSLVNRVSAFFLAALAIVLLANSVIFYLLARHQLRTQFDEQLHAALHTLVAAVEVEDDDVKWEISDHTIDLGTEDGSEDVRWIVCTENGNRIDQSKNLVDNSADDAQFLRFAESLGSTGDEPVDVGGWGILQRRLAAPHPKPASERDVLEHEAIVVIVGRSAVDLNANLRLLAILVTALPFGAWLIAAVAGRWFCAKALRPVKAMAVQTRRMSKDSFSGRLAVPDSNDELSDLAQAFNALLDKLSEAFERQSRFAGDAAHQLRTPISVLLGQIEVALRNPRTAEDYQSTLGKLRGEAQELGQMVASLLFLARSDAEAVPQDLQSMELSHWFDRYLERWHDHTRWQDIRCDIEPGLHALVSPHLLSQLMDNLIDNALKYSSPESQVSIVARTDGTHVRVSVTDEGIGIPVEDQESLFQPFYRSQRARQTGETGTGLGLAIAARIAGAMKATLQYEPNLPRGSRFVLELEKAARPVSVLMAER